MRCSCLQIEWDWRRINYNGEIEDKLLEKEHWRGLIQIRQKQVTEAVQNGRVLWSHMLPNLPARSKLGEGSV